MKRIILLFGICISAVACATEPVGSEYEFPVTIIPTEDIPENMDLFLCIGQSNMAGRGILDESKGDYEPMDNVYLLDSEGNMVVATNPMNQYSTVKKNDPTPTTSDTTKIESLPLQRLSPSYSFAKKVAAETGRAIGLVVNAKGGTSIESWVPGHYLYDAAVERAKEAMKYGTFKGIIWHQGEADSSTDKVKNYPDNLKKMVDALREELGNPDLYFVAGEVAQWNRTADNFNNMIHGISDFLENADWVSSEGLTPLIDESDPHFNRWSQLVLGERYADKVLEHVYGATPEE